ncbi:hypothetical protein GCM10010439_07610 [Actinocorallia aurantiaca]|uniref:Uncharacterized protein n=1 Tax=Actinocorallia aurantiaca TaxID=46204 RepID=A0ABN3TW71_9ACTN
MRLIWGDRFTDMNAMAMEWQKRQVRNLALYVAVVSEGRSQPFAHAPTYPSATSAAFACPDPHWAGTRSSGWVSATRSR